MKAWQHISVVILYHVNYLMYYTATKTAFNYKLALQPGLNN